MEPEDIAYIKLNHGKFTDKLLASAEDGNDYTELVSCAECGSATYEDCENHCLSFTVSVLPYAAISEGTFDDRHNWTMSAEQYWCNDAAVPVAAERAAEVAEDEQDLTKLGTACGLYQIEYEVAGFNGGVAQASQLVFTLSRNSTEIDPAEWGSADSPSWILSPDTVDYVHLHRSGRLLADAVAVSSDGTVLSKCTECGAATYNDCEDHCVSFTVEPVPYKTSDEFDLDLDLTKEEYYCSVSGMPIAANKAADDAEETQVLSALAGACSLYEIKWRATGLDDLVSSSLQYVFVYDPDLDVDSKLHSQVALLAAKRTEAMRQDLVAADASATGTKVSAALLVVGGVAAVVGAAGFTSFRHRLGYSSLA